MHRMRQSTLDGLVVYDWLVGIAALGLSLWFLYLGLGGDAATLEQHNAVAFSMMVLGISAIVWVTISITSEYWWGGFAYAGASVAFCFAVYGAYAVRP